MGDGANAISYENLLSTLYQKKMLAIKRECEAKKVEKQRRQQQNCLGSLIFGNRPDQSRERDDGLDPDERTSYPSIKQQATVTDADGEQRAEPIDSQVIRGAQPSEMAESATDIETGERKSTEIDNNAVELQADVMDRPRHTADDQIFTATPTDAHSTQSRNDNKAIASELDVESSSTTTNSKSASIVSQIEMSDEIQPKRKHTARKYSSDTISMASSMKHTALSAPADVLHDQEQRLHIRLLEAKSISAQCSPIFAQRQMFNGTFFCLSLLAFCPL